MNTFQTPTPTFLLSPESDPMGQAIADYYASGQKMAPLKVLSSMFDDDEMPVSILFRTAEEMPAIEQKALSLCKGNVLDVGAGAGCHALELQRCGLNVTAIDISALAIATMQKRGVQDTRQLNFFDTGWAGHYTTLLLLMNGSGIIGRIDRMGAFFRRAKELLLPGGQILMDSSDLRYVFENEDGTLDIDLNAGYYGEVDFRMQYRHIQGKSFDWLYVDFDTLAYHANANGFDAELVMQGDHYDYLARLTPTHRTSIS